MLNIFINDLINIRTPGRAICLAVGACVGLLAAGVATGRWDLF